MDFKKIPPAVFELLGALVLILPLVLGAIRGLDLAGLLFGRVITTLEITLWLRTIYFPVFLAGLLLTMGAIVLIVRSRNREELKDWMIYTRLGLYFASGYILVTWILHWVLDGIFYRGAFVTFSYVLGILLLIILLLQLAIDMTELRQPQFPSWRKIGKIARFVLLGTLALIIIIPTILPLSGALPSPSVEPPTYGGKPGPYSVEQTRLVNQVPANISTYLVPDNDNSTWYTFVYYPQLQQPRTLPLVLFAHGLSGTDPREYQNTFYQLASQGAVVIYVQYATEVKLSGPFAEPENTNFTSSNANYLRYSMTWGGMLQAVDTLQSGGFFSGSMSTDYLLIIGHSVGGGMVPYLATNAVQQGWGQQMLILDMETPWFSSENALTPYNLSILPNYTMVNIVGSQDDHLASPCIGMKQYERYRKYLPERNLAYIINRSDDHGYPRLVATHYLITARLNDHLTLWGYLKRVDAMTVMLVQQSNNNPISTANYFLGGLNTMVDQGLWTDGRPINRQVYSQDPFGQRGGNNIADDYIDAHAMGPEVCTV